ncbi:hypothetical protein E0Z10_g10326 [Xylaria hypoxylon]|uniref:FAD/NAD(P)-binding domain-containing protein n=1 Tax=Xylaria hypoxylon TaxID=37992 RepID=A0A4Z0YGQ0_9PEZI|nr:hypothetical protein E0Z10_g10326 [Xylaria hypoxylon]
MSSTSADYAAFPPGVEYPSKADLRKDVHKSLPTITPGAIDPASIAGDMPAVQAKAALDAVNAALASNDAKKLASLFYAEQAFWKDIAALTNHLRTFTTPSVVAAALLQMKVARQIEGNVELARDPDFVVLSPATVSSTQLPLADCLEAKPNPLLMLLFPVRADASKGPISWKIWVLTTWAETLLQHPEDVKLLFSPGRDLDKLEIIETDVFILGAGTAGLGTAARLKALGVESIAADRNARVGDNWNRRYDCLKIHVPTANCELPYTYYKKELQDPYLLTKYDVAEHSIQYAKDFQLNVILSAKVQSTVYHTLEKKWTIVLDIANGSGAKTIICNHFIQATGAGGGRPYIPAIQGEDLYKGVSVHSTRYQNAQLLAKDGVKSVVVIGSANTAFDIIEDCHAAGLKTTLVARSPTYVLPFEHIMDPHSIGAYTVLPLDTADRVLNTMPEALSGPFAQALLSHLASQEPDRYLALSQAGFPVLDSRDPSVNIQHNLLERCGGHYLDVGGTKLISEGKVAVRGNVEPIAYTDTGLRLSDGSELTADAVIWGTGFADLDNRATVIEALGGTASQETKNKDVLTPVEIGARLDACWGVDAEGEVRGMAKRHLRMENYWIIGGTFQNQRWWSRHMVQQIKLSLESSLPPAYRDTPEPDLEI